MGLADASVVIEGWDTLDGDLSSILEAQLFLDVAGRSARLWLSYS